MGISVGAFVKIALVNGNPGWGGGEQWFLDASEALARRGHDLTLAAWSEGPLFQRSVRSGKKTYALRSLPQVLLDHKPHVVLCNNGRDLRRVLKAGGVHPLSFRVVLRRGIDRPLKDTIFRRPSWKSLSTILVNSDATKGTVERSLPWFPKDRIQRLYNPVAFTPLSRVAGTEGTFRFGAAGRLVKQKGFDLLLRAFARMDASLACTLEVAGEGKQRSRLEKLHRRLNLGARCRLLGHVRDMPSFYARLDGLVMPSWYEGFGFAAVEAALAELPVLASEVSSLPEIVDHEETGLLVPPGDVAALVRAMENLVGRGDRGRSLGAEARRRALQRFDPETLQDELNWFLVKAAELPPVAEGL